MLLSGRSSLAGWAQDVAALLAAGLEDGAAALGELAGAESGSPSPLPAWAKSGGVSLPGVCMEPHPPPMRGLFCLPSLLMRCTSCMCVVPGLV